MAKFALIIVCLGSIIGPLGMASVNVAIPDLAADLHANAKMVSWLPTLFILSSVVFMLPAGKLADNYGRKSVYASGLALNAFASFMCALGDSIEWVLFWRFVQGGASSMIFATGIAIITSVTPAAKRGAALGIASACIYVGLTIAPAVGGWLTELWGWRAVFLFQVPLVVALLTLIALRLTGEWKNQHKTRFDWWGTGIFALFASSLVYGLSVLPTLLGVVMLALSAGSLSLFVLHQSRSRRPLIRVQMFRDNRVFSLSLCTSLLMYASNFPLVFLMSLYLQYVKGLSPLHAGQVILVQALSMAIMAPIAGKLADKVQARLIATLGCVIVACGLLVLSQISIQTSMGYIVTSLLLIGFGFGLFSTPNNNAIMGAVQQHEVGVASATLNLSRTIGNLFGMSLVNLMVHYYLGDAQFTAEQPPALVHTFEIALLMSLTFVAIACVTSTLRGRAGNKI
ncbi:MFS transporter [Paraglaciecola aquimarina]|uniref:MFS transporter n=1 Tax=Paraglaciecola aquimarina TaxID=1235557 RepID=A0ABU3SYD5_9ALTE|nr:MFS transporter [Paraglaciecola aquimarina]MDU0355024.1 MFS transporter [Paraglaciecola aquimarina]